MREGGVMTTPAPSTFAALLESAVNEPGILSSAYRAFHNYSIGNQLLAWAQCIARNMQPGPMATFPKWKELGRHVKKGEKGITLCQPVTVTRTTKADDGDEQAEMMSDVVPSVVYTRFVYKSRWFVLSQTDGQPLAEPPMPTWNRAAALKALDVNEVPFDALNGNCLGFARGRSIAINPVNPLPHKTTFHELAHVLLGHTTEGEQNDGELTPRNLRECEAEAVALLCCAALDLPGVDHCRGYIQNWWGAGNAIPEKSSQRILKVADQILKAGCDESVEPAVHS
jgi:antirestriction protein ArdC